MSTRRPAQNLVVDVALMLVVLGFSLSEVLTGQVPGPLWAGIVSALGFSVPLLFRREHAWTVLVVVYGMLVFCVATGVSTYQYMGSVIGCVVALGTLAAQSELVPSLFALAASYAVLLLTALRDPGGWLWGLVIVGAVWVGGRMMYQRRVLIDRLRSTAAELELSRELVAEAAVAQERSRLARELHDVIAHSVSVMVVQSGAAERMVTLDPARAERALASVQATGREALVELRHLLGVLRTDDESNEDVLTPQPDLDDVDRLAAQLQQTGLDLSLSRTGGVRRLGPGVELAAYRILQEALTNVLKHGHAHRAEVEIEYGDACLVLSVRDDGTGGPPIVDGSGNGLRGMTERAELYGGTLQAGPRPEGGYVVRAELPIAPTAPVAT